MGAIKILCHPNTPLLVEGTVRSENNRSPNRPIDLVEESIGGCLALAVAAQNPDVDLMLILSNPATCFKKSPLQLLTTYLEIMPEQLHLSAPYMLCLVTVKGGRLTTCQFSLVQSFGIPLTMAMATVKKGFSLQKRVGELSYGLMALSSYLYVLADVLPRETLLWKLRMLRSAAAYANSRLHAVKAQTLILSNALSMENSMSSKKHRHRHGHGDMTPHGIDDIVGTQIDEREREREREREEEEEEEDEDDNNEEEEEDDDDEMLKKRRQRDRRGDRER
ncbi:hypothetical protein HYC85_002726 [Camellia sinensis]|uniref:Serine aminopeptidase S33 domain-containing protein n=1 Tax=Camellia sinensis TaxID=4442 RepID=A0A7J7IAC2_CAMSI|nr:hypothetical protein HYC85_002726 [Camellia sinensis]